MGIVTMLFLISQLTFVLCQYQEPRPTPSNMIYGENTHADPPNPNDFKINYRDKIGYKVMYFALPWVNAKRKCESEGFQMAVPRTQDQFNFIQLMVRNMSYARIEGTTYRHLTWVGIGFDEYAKAWKTVEGDDIYKSGFHKWADGETFRANSSPEIHMCAGVDAFHKGLKEFQCQHHQPYVCETHITDFAIPGKLKEYAPVVETG